MRQTGAIKITLNLLRTDCKENQVADHIIYDHKKALPPVIHSRVNDPNFQQIRPSLYENGALSNFKFNV